MVYKPFGQNTENNKQKSKTGLNESNYTTPNVKPSNNHIK